MAERGSMTAIHHGLEYLVEAEKLATTIEIDDTTRGAIIKEITALPIDLEQQLKSFEKGHAEKCDDIGREINDLFF